MIARGIAARRGVSHAGRDLDGDLHYWFDKYSTKPGVRATTTQK
jgi:hypothetical protein